MSLFLMVVTITSVTFIWRFASLTLTIRQTSPFWGHFLRFVPIAIFSALVMSSLYKGAEPPGPSVIILAIAGAIAWRTRQFGLSVLAGVVVLWLLVALGVR